MADTSLEGQLGRVVGQQEMILRELSDARADRKQHYIAIDDIRGSVLTLDGRMTIVEEAIMKFGPTIDEFIEIKHKVIAAGKLGKWLWIAGFALIGLIAKFRVELMTWISK